MSIMSDDTKIKRLRRKYGLEGYGLYVLILEYIAKQLDKHSPLPDLQEKANDISDEWGCDIRRVNEMMLDMVNEGLFEVDYITGKLVCTKIEKYLDEYIRKIPEIGSAIEEFRYNQGMQLYITEGVSESVRQSPTNSDKLPLEETRTEQNRREEREQPKEDTLPKKVKHPGTGLAMSATRYSALCDKHGSATVDDYMERIQLYCESKPRKPYADAAATAATWIRKDIDKGTFRGIQSYDYDEDIKKKTAYFGAKD